MTWQRLRTGLLGLVLVWSALFPFAAEAMTRASGDGYRLLCAPQIRGELSGQDAVNLAILAKLSGQSAEDDAAVPALVCDDCLACPVLALPAAALTDFDPPDRHALLRVRRTGLPCALPQARLRPDARAPPRVDHQTA
ncbi:hypothetical protein [Maricaulis maris]|uniref:hypothetical protein n=1 Tax=Maricaulis maris TaxID=74318 RepID=UPI003B8DBE02